MAVVIAFLGLVAFVGIVTAASVLNGWALMLLWNWFAVPLLGLPALASIPAAIGLGLVVSLLRPIQPPSNKEKSWAPFAFIFIHPLLSVLIGYIVKQLFV